jgi:hypothetical protein
VCVLSSLPSCVHTSFGGTKAVGGTRAGLRLQDGGGFIRKENHQFSASAVELEFLRSERRLRSGRHFA